MRTWTSGQPAAWRTAGRPCGPPQGRAACEGRREAFQAGRRLGRSCWGPGGGRQRTSKRKGRVDPSLSLSLSPVFSGNPKGQMSSHHHRQTRLKRQHDRQTRMLYHSIVALALVGSAASFSLQGAARLTTPQRSMGPIMDEVHTCRRLHLPPAHTFACSLDLIPRRMRRRLPPVPSRATSGTALPRSRSRAAPSRRGTSARR